MFDSPFPYTKINHHKVNDSAHNIIAHNYYFYGKTGDRYNVLIEHYEYNVYAVKFYLHKHKNFHNKYQLLTGNFECNRVIATIAAIMKELFISNKTCSFVFVGINCEKEQKNNTRRFRIYSTAVAFVIAPVHFEHNPAPRFSAYLLLNRANTDKEIKLKIETLFNSIYFLEDSPTQNMMN